MVSTIIREPGEVTELEYASGLPTNGYVVVCQVCRAIFDTVLAFQTHKTTKHVELNKGVVGL